MSGGTSILLASLMTLVGIPLMPGLLQARKLLKIFATIVFVNVKFLGLIKLREIKLSNLLLIEL